MLIGTFCRSSVRLCAVTVTVPRVLTFCAAAEVVAADAGCSATSWASAGAATAKLIAAASGKRANITRCALPPHLK